MQKPKNRKPYPDPLTIEPLSTQHTHTFIILHGRGSNAERFGHELLASANLAARLPTVKFVFPTASKRRSTILKKTPINQWFDNYSLDDPNERTDLQVDGLRETGEFLRRLIDKEAHVFDSTGGTGYQKIILGGLSQGCTASIFALLGGHFGESGNESLAAFFGMSGWLPFEKQLNNMFYTVAMEAKNEGEDSNDDDESDLLTGYMQQLDMEPSEEGESSDEYEEEDEEERTLYDDTDNDDKTDVALRGVESDHTTFTTEDQVSFFPFQSIFQEDTPSSDIMDTINYIRDILDLPQISIAASDQGNRDGSKDTATCSHSLRTPVFLGHGSADPKVSVRLGEKMAKFLSNKLKMDVTWKAYEGFGHWYKVPDEIDDVLGFLQRKTDLSVVDG
ncbi:Alpha/Beta hydrolase protein [Talaromyces proteolyticus]|uniref:Alpha/Beta hydrolase protein n=1 Tax=Talaromyces proteolyticus TaxID=1131652 RepID=A0AAD4L185_9EURO|nr:Alpha/Beta hydrolase protein [Talaromyces proteolyticus]KAH8702000.1 Alpha/Beta hydrolase protein [Talaromyces proteolyticus]